MLQKKIRCRLCHSEELRYLFSANQHQLLRCPQCDFVQVAQQPTKTEIEKIYEQTYFAHNKYKDQTTLQKENHRRLQLTKKYVPPGAMVLDAGCGMGDFIHASKSHFMMHGFDLSSSGIKMAKNNNPEIAHRIWCGRLEEQKLSHATFDAICSWDVIEHIWDPMPAYAQLLDYLRPNGYLFLSTPNIGAPLARLLGKYWAFMTPPEHLSFFSKQNMEYFARKLNAELLFWRSKGKWANFGFILYKIKRIAPRSLPAPVSHVFERGNLSKLSIYAPTGDIQYCVIKKRTA